MHSAVGTWRSLRLPGKCMHAITNTSGVFTTIYLRPGNVRTHGTPLPISPGLLIRAKYFNPLAHGVLQTAHMSDVTILICALLESAE